MRGVDNGEVRVVLEEVNVMLKQVDVDGWLPLMLHNCERAGEVPVVVRSVNFGSCTNGPFRPWP